jgi:hypothetical protein
MLMLAQIDDRSGEVLGRALEELMDMGARNVQLLSSHTKKGRPGTVLLIDLEPELEPEVAVYLAAELGAWGYHILAAEHRHFEVTQEDRIVTIVCVGESRTFTLPCKFFTREDELLRVKIERSDVEDVHRFIRTLDDACSTDTVRTVVEHEIRRHPDKREIEVRFS